MDIAVVWGALVYLPRISVEVTALAAGTAEGAKVDGLGLVEVVAHRVGDGGHMLSVARREAWAVETLRRLPARGVSHAEAGAGVGAARGSRLEGCRSDADREPEVWKGRCSRTET